MLPRRLAQSLVGASNTTSAPVSSSPSRRINARSAESTSWIIPAPLPSCAARTRSDQALAQRVRDGVGAVAELQSAGDVMEDVLDRALAVAELGGDLRGAVAVGDEPEHLGLPVREPGEGEAARLEDLPLQPAHLVQQTAQEVGRHLALAGNDTDHHTGQPFRG